jgi:hypothetical protein
MEHRQCDLHPELGDQPLVHVTALGGRRDLVLICPTCLGERIPVQRGVERRRAKV